MFLITEAQTAATNYSPVINNKIARIKLYFLFSLANICEKYIFLINLNQLKLYTLIMQILMHKLSVFNQRVRISTPTSNHSLYFQHESFWNLSRMKLFSFGENALHGAIGISPLHGLSILDNATRCKIWFLLVNLFGFI